MGILWPTEHTTSLHKIYIELQHLFQLYKDAPQPVKGWEPEGQLVQK